MVHTIIFKDNDTNEEINYLFDKNSYDVKFVKYITNIVSSIEPRIEEVEELWYIKSLERDVKIKKKYTYSSGKSEITKRLELNNYGKDNINPMDKVSQNEYVFMEWNPSILDNPKNLQIINNYTNKYSLYLKNKIHISNDCDLIFINENMLNKHKNIKNIKNKFNFNNNNNDNNNNDNENENENENERYEDTIKLVNNLSSKMNNYNKLKTNKPVLPIPKSYKGNCINKINTNANNSIRKLAEQHIQNNTSNLFMPVIINININNDNNDNDDNDDNNDNNDNNNDNNDDNDNGKLLGFRNKSGLFKVKKYKDSQYGKRYTFIIKGIPYPNNTNNECIINSICNVSLIIKNNPSLISIYILKDKKTHKQKNMCLANFNTEKVKNEVLADCIKSRVYLDNCSLIIEDGNNNDD